MIDPNFIDYLWVNRHTYIHIEGLLLNQEEVEYIKETLQKTNLTPTNCHITDYNLLHTILEQKEKGKTTTETKNKLEKSNKIIESTL